MASISALFVVLLAHFALTNAGPSGASTVASWRCAGQRIQGQDIWQEAVDRCRDRNLLCKHICLLQKLTILDRNLQYSEQEMFDVVDGSLTANDLRSELKTGMTKCSRKIHDGDLSDTCGGNKDFVLCVADLVAKVCEIKRFQYGFSGEEFPQTAPPQQQFILKKVTQKPKSLLGLGILGL